MLRVSSVDSEFGVRSRWVSRQISIARNETGLIKVVVAERIIISVQIVPGSLFTVLA